VGGRRGGRISGAGLGSEEEEGEGGAGGEGGGGERVVERVKGTRL